MSKLIALDEIEASKSQIFKVMLEGELLDKFNAYLTAYQESYGAKPSPSSILTRLIEFGFKKDVKFKNWYNSLKKSKKTTEETFA